MPSYAQTTLNHYSGISVNGKISCAGKLEQESSSGEKTYFQEEPHSNNLIFSMIQYILVNNHVFIDRTAFKQEEQKLSW